MRVSPGTRTGGRLGESYMDIRGGGAGGAACVGKICVSSASISSYSEDPLVELISSPDDSYIISLGGLSLHVVVAQVLTWEPS